MNNIIDFQPDRHNLHVVMVMPDIPQNTGNIARLCLATGSQLVLVRPLGFRLSDSQLQRAGMDYWKKLQPLILNDLDEFFSWSRDKNVYCLSAHGKKNYAQISYRQSDAFCFGSESSGLPRIITDQSETLGKLLTLPMIKDVRCLNVSSAVSIVVYEALRQINGWNPYL